MTSRFCFRFATSSRLKKGRKPPFAITAYKGCNKSRKVPPLSLRLDEPAPNFTFSGIGRLPARRPYRPSSAQRSFIRGVCAWTKSGLIHLRSYCCYWLLPLSARWSLRPQARMACRNRRQLSLPLQKWKSAQLRPASSSRGRARAPPANGLSLATRPLPRAA